MRGASRKGIYRCQTCRFGCADFSVWQRELLKGEELERQLSYWKRQLADLTVLELPTDRPRPKMQSYLGSYKSLFISRELVEALNIVSRREHLTVFMTMTAALQVLLYRYSGQDDIALGVPVAGRNRLEIENLIGFFVNTLVLRGDLSGNPTFKELMARVREAALGGYAHQDLPFEKLVEVLQPPRDMSRNPLFQVMFSMQHDPVVELNLDGITASPVTFDWKISKFDLSFYLNDDGNGLHGMLEYNTDLFNPSTIERLAGHYEVLLKSIAADPDRSHRRFSFTH